MWIKLIILSILVLNSVNCGRKKQTAQEEFVDKEIIRETLDAVRIQLNTLNQNRLEKYTLDSNKLGLLLDALDALGDESVQLVIILIDSHASSCLEQIGKVGVNEAECTISEDDIKFYISYRGSLNNVDELTKLIESLQFVEDNVMKFKTQLLSQRRDNFHGYIENVQSQKDVTQSVLKGESKYYKQTQLEVYVDEVDKTLKNLESEIDNLVKTSTQEQNAVEHDTSKVTEGMSEAVHSGANYTAQFVCDVEINGDTNALKKYLDLDDIADQRKLLEKLLDDVMQRLSTETLNDNTQRKVDEILTRIDNSTKFLKDLFEANHKKQMNLLNAFQEALKNNNEGKQEEILKQITNHEEAAKVIREIYAEKNNLEDALAACYRFEKFGPLVAGLLALNNTKGVKLSKPFEDLVYDKMLERLKLNFQDEVFCCHSASLVHAVYQVEPNTAILILIRLQKALDASDFYVGEQRWLNEVIIFLYNNLKIALKNTCNPDLYKPIFNRNYQKYFRRVLAYVKVLRILEPDDLKLFEMTGNVQKLILAYWKDPKHLETLEICNEYKK